jgi:hypothetical protein
MTGMTLFWDAIPFKDWNLIFATVLKHLYGLVCPPTWLHVVFGQQDLCYSAKAFVWLGLSADMAPRGFWTAGMIPNFWNMKPQSKATESNAK